MGLTHHNGHLKYKLVIFDFDGTLADSIPWVRTIINGIADKYGIRQITDDEVETLRGMSIRALAKYMHVPWYKVPRIARDLRVLMQRDIDRIPLFDGIDGLLGTLDSQGVRLAVVSSNTRDNVQRILGPENAARIAYFECGVALMGKTMRFRKILRHSGVKAGEALCIGDEIRDLEAAQKARIAFGAVSWGYNLPATLAEHSPRVLFAAVRDIEAEVVGG